MASLQTSADGRSLQSAARASRTASAHGQHARDAARTMIVVHFDMDNTDSIVERRHLPLSRRDNVAVGDKVAVTSCGKKYDATVLFAGTADECERFLSITAPPPRGNHVEVNIHTYIHTCVYTLHSAKSAQ